MRYHMRQYIKFRDHCVPTRLLARVTPDHVGVATVALVGGAFFVVVTVVIEENSLEVPEGKALCPLEV
eukprot:4294229-Heterocapsa_arctica.AAC.1